MEQTVDGGEVGIGVVCYETFGHIKHPQEALHASITTAAVGEDDERLVEDDAENGAVERVGYDELRIGEATQPLWNGGETDLILD